MHTAIRRAALAALLLAPLGAVAHHAEGYATPQTIGSGLLSGFAHPGIELGQVAFLVALGACCARWPAAGPVIARFVAGSAIGVLLAALGLLGPAEPLLPLALLGVAVALAWRGGPAGSTAMARVAGGATVLAGLVHGQAAIEPAVGAPVAAFLAYAGAMLVAQLVIVMVARGVIANVLPAGSALQRSALGVGAAACVVAAVAVALQPGLSLL
jgi:hypothetical protein